MESEKVCEYCGRTFEWRAKWRNCWEQVRYCSKRCQRERRSELDQRIEQAIREVTSQRGRTKTACPSEVAKAMDAENWRGLMERVRCAARRLARQGDIAIVKQGKRVDPDEVHGPIRLVKR